MKIIPKADQLVGRIVDMNRSKGGLVMPETKSMVNVTMLLLVDDVGPDVQRCKPGDFIVYHQCHHVYFRDGTHYAMAVDKDVRAVVEGLDRAQLEIEGESKPPKGEARAAV